MRGPVVTIARQRGSGAEEIAALVARQLGIPLYDQQVLTRAATEAGVSEATIADAERRATFLERILESLGCYAALGVDGMTALPSNLPPLTLLRSSAEFRSIIEEVLRNLADNGPGVIVGHAAGQVALRGRPDVLHVFIHAPVERRVRRLVVEERMSRADAEHEVQRSDQERAAFFRGVYNLNWCDLRLYDLVLNSAACLYEDAADQICGMSRHCLLAA